MTVYAALAERSKAAALKAVDGFRPGVQIPHAAPQAEQATFLLMTIGKDRYTGVPFPGMPDWRNWQTHRTQNAATQFVSVRVRYPAREGRFESCSLIEDRCEGSQVPSLVICVQDNNPVLTLVRQKIPAASR